MHELDEMDTEYLKTFESKRFLALVSDKYKIPLEELSALFKDFDLNQRDPFGMGDYDPVEKTMEKIADETRLSKKAIRRLQQIGVLPRPVTVHDFELLGLLSSACRDAYFIRCMLSGYSHKQLDKLFKRPELVAKWERWAYTRFLTNEINYGAGGRMLNPKKRIKIYDLAEQIEEMFKVPNCLNTREKLKKIREKATNDRNRSRTESKPLEELASRRGISKSEMEMALGLWEPRKQE